MKILKTILDIVFPNYCIICHAKGSDLCADCLYKAQISEKEVEEYVYPLYDYRDTIIKRAIWNLKYKNKKNLSLVFAEIMYPKILEELGDMKAFENFTNPILIPIPVSKKRLKERGYNQSLLIAKELNKIDRDKSFVLMNNILIKHKETIHQAHVKNKKERLANLIGSFSVINKELIKNRNIILIDDVTTTGATLKEAKKELKKNGARKIIAFTIAH
ncbi:MAG: phosphoribosyltransferase family protein [Candidatus Paceibacterota bacterium]